VGGDDVDRVHVVGTGMLSDASGRPSAGARSWSTWMLERSSSCDGFQVRDHTGALIPAEGAEVQDSPVLQRRLREGLLVVAPEGTPLPVPAGANDEPFDIESLTVPELRANLTDRGVEFEPTAKKAELQELLSDALEAEAAAGE
ncbi:MAG: HeH/LEM domain-containing protein, partial [Planctomycetota bacterium]